MLSAIVIEIVLTCGFLLVIHGATDKHAPAGLCPIAIGPALTLIHLISIPVTNTSVNLAQHRGGNFPWRLGAAAAVAVLGHATVGGIRRRAVSHLLEKRD